MRLPRLGGVQNGPKQCCRIETKADPGGNANDNVHARKVAL